MNNQEQRVGRGRVHHFVGRLPGVTYGPFIPWADVRRFSSIHSEAMPYGANSLLRLVTLILNSLSRLVFTQPLIGNYGVPSSARDENGLLKYFESPVCIFGLISTPVVE